MNFIQIAGHLGNDPEVRFTANNLKVVTFRVATKVRRKDQDDTIWWRVTLFGDRFDKMLAYLKKGSAIVVVGELNKPEIYTDKNGNPQVSLEIVAEFLRFSPFGKPDGNKQEQQEQEQKKPQGSAQYNPYGALEQQEAKAPYAFGNQMMTGRGQEEQHSEEEKLPF